MQLKTLLFNRGIYTQSLKGVGWISLIHAICLFFALPLQILMITSKNNNYLQHYRFMNGTLFEFSEGLQIILMFTVPVLTAVFLFRYMHVKLSADYIHSLPLKREALYHHNFLLGLILLALPVLITAVSLLIIGSFIEAPTLLTTGLIGKWAGSTLLANFFVFTASVFVAMYTGISTFQAVLTYILFLLPVGSILVLFYNIRYFLKGFAAEYYLTQQLEKLVPFVRAVELSRNPLSWQEVIAIITICIIFYGLALLTYRKRKIETAAQAISIRSLQPVFLYGVTLCSMLLGGVYFGELLGTFGWRIFGYVSASFICYFIASMILEKSWRVLTKWKGYSIFFAIMCMFAVLIKVDFTGYENRIPELSNIERVYFSQGFGGMAERSNVVSTIAPYQSYNYYSEPENIANVLMLHKEAIEKDRHSKEAAIIYRQVVFVYELTNGRKLVRQYQVPESFYSEPSESLRKIWQTAEYKWNQNGVLRVEDSDIIDKITVTAHRGMESKVLAITDPEEIESFHRTLQTEILNEEIDTIYTTDQSWAGIEYLLNNNERVYSDWKISYERIEAWLLERGLLNKARITADDIAYAFVGKKSERDLYIYMDEIENFMQTPEWDHFIEITDYEQIEDCLKRSLWYNDSEYVIIYFSKSQQRVSFVEGLHQEALPQWLKEKLQ